MKRVLKGATDDNALWISTSKASAKVMVTPDFVFRNSRFLENVLEHRFLFDLCRSLVLRQPPVVANIMRSEVDAFGIDLVIAANGNTVHLQMKTRSGTPEVTPYEISETLWTLPNAIVVWMLYDADDVQPTSYLIFGAPLPALDEFRPSRRGGFRNVEMSQATHKYVTLDQLAEILFPSRPIDDVSAGPLK